MSEHSIDPIPVHVVSSETQRVRDTDTSDIATWSIYTLTPTQLGPLKILPQDRFRKRAFLDICATPTGDGNNAIVLGQAKQVNSISSGSVGGLLLLPQSPHVQIEYTSKAELWVAAFHVSAASVISIMVLDERYVNVPQQTTEL